MPLPRPADVGLVLLTAAVVAGAVYAVQDDPDPLATPRTSATPTAAPSATSSPSPSPKPAAVTRRLLLVGADLDRLVAPLAALAWDVQTAPADTGTVVADGALEALSSIPAVVVLEVQPGTRTSERVAGVVDRVGAAFPDAVVVLLTPFDPEATRTASAVKQAGAAAAVVVIDPVEQGWAEGAEPDEVAAQLDEALRAEL